MQDLDPRKTRETVQSRSSFSLLTLFLLVAIAALIACLFSYRQQMLKAIETSQKAIAMLDEIELELAETRSKFGYIDVKDPQLTYFAKITDSESDDSYRAVFPKDSRYLMHVSDTPMKHSKVPDDLPRTRTVSLNSWTDGTDVIVKWGVWGAGDSKKMVVETKTGELLTYKLKDWNNGNWPNEGFDLEASPQVSFKTDEKIILSYFGNEKLERGIILWMEPYEQWEARNKSEKKK